jgi:hypothetical protein
MSSTIRCTTCRRQRETEPAECQARRRSRWGGHDTVERSLLVQAWIIDACSHRPGTTDPADFPSAQSHDGASGVQLTCDAGLARLACICSGVDDPDRDRSRKPAIVRAVQRSGTGGIHADDAVRKRRRDDGRPAGLDDLERCTAPWDQGGADSRRDSLRPVWNAARRHVRSSRQRDQGCRQLQVGSSPRAERGWCRPCIGDRHSRCRLLGRCRRGGA